jgi:uncharacterized protein
VRTFYFGESGRRLYGAYTEPAQTRRGAPAVLLCYPGVHEYNTAHWAFRRLAASLSRAGYPSLRFDYLGTGDSDGAVEETTFSSMVGSVQTAARELLDLSGARKLWLVGLRLGAAAAAVASLDELPVRGLVLWDAVTSGEAYLGELRERDRLRDLLFLHWAEHPLKSKELLGYPLPDSVRDSIAEVNLGTLLEAREKARPPEQVLLLREGDAKRDAALSAFWSGQGAEVVRHELASGGGVDRLISGNEVLLSSEAIAAIVEAIGGEREK